MNIVKRLMMLGLVVSTGALAKVQIIGDFLISKAPVKTWQEANDFCREFGVASIQQLSRKEFGRLGTYFTDEQRKRMATASPYRGGALHFTKNMAWISKEQIKSYRYGYPVCKGARGYKEKQLASRSKLKMAPVTKNPDLIGVNLNGTVSSEFGSGYKTRETYNGAFREYLLWQLLQTHHWDDLKDSKKRSALIKHYKPLIEIPGKQGVIQFSMVDIEKENASGGDAKYLYRKDPVIYKLYQSNKDKLAKITISYEETTGGILELMTEQVIPMIEENLPNVAQQLSDKWQVPIHKVGKSYVFTLSEYKQCELKIGTKGFWSRKSKDVVRITCSTDNKFDYLRTVDTKFKNFIEDFLRNPPKRPNLTPKVHI